MGEGELRGMIADIQRFSLHDGPGIRTTVFLKGCNLRCAWCHNPETISFQPQVLLRPEKCIGCGGCEDGCFSGARVLCGVERTVDDVLRDVLLDAPFYGTDGGVTVSGGEPLCQLQFTAALLAACRATGVRTAVESNMTLPWEVAWSVLQYCDLLMADLKLWDLEEHRRWTGQSNREIKANLLRAADAGLPVLLRTPVIPGVNDREEEIRAIARFAKGLNTLVCYELLPYHPLGLSKGQLEGWQATEFAKPSADRMMDLAQAAMEEGVEVRLANTSVTQKREGEHE